MPLQSHKIGCVYKTPFHKFSYKLERTFSLHEMATTSNATSAAQLASMKLVIIARKYQTYPFMCVLLPNRCTPILRMIS